MNHQGGQSWTPITPPKGSKSHAETQIPARFRDRPFHQHNRLIKNVAFNAEERRALAGAMADRLAGATGPTRFLLPKGGIEEWDRPGGPAHDPAGLAAFCDAAEAAMAGRVPVTLLDCHINDTAFCDAVLAQLDAWVAAGVVPPGVAA